MINKIRPIKDLEGKTVVRYEVECDLILSYDSMCCFVVDEDYEMEYEDKVIKVACTLPGDFFEPLQINVKVPEELMAGIEGQVQEVQIPISIDDESQNIIIKESVIKGNGFFRSGIIGMLKRAICVLDKESVEEEKKTKKFGLRS